MRRILFGALAPAVLWIVSCGAPLTENPSVTTTSDGPQTEAQPGADAARQGDALVRLVNADLDPTGVDLLGVNGALFSDVAPKTVTAYLEVPRGMTLFRLRTAAGVENLTSGYRELVPGRHYTLVALPKAKGGTRLAILSDSLGLLEPGQTRVRLINATTDLDDLDLFVAGSASHVLHGIDAGRTATTSFADMEAGSVEIRSPNRPAPTLLAKLNVETDRLYTFIVIGEASALDLVQIVDRTTT